MSPTSRRSERFDQEFGIPHRSATGAASVDEARAIVHRALSSIGLDPEEVTDPDGWCHIELGTAYGLINVIEWKPEVHFLAVWSPVLRVPDDPRLRAKLFETLLRLNHHDTGIARASLQGDLVVLSYVRPIQGLDEDEVVDAVRMVMVAADALDEPLRDAFDVTMPAIDLDQATWQGVLELQRLCDGHTQTIFKQLLEGWASRGGAIEAGGSGIGLQAKSAGNKTLAALVGYASAGPIVVIGWDSLSRQWGLRPEDEAAFKKAVPRPLRFTATKNTAHLPVDESFTEAMGDQLLDALAILDKALVRAVPPEPLPLPNLKERWNLRVDVGGATQRGIDSTLEACAPAVQEAYRLLIQGWDDAGQKLYTNALDRVYLRSTVDEHTFGLCTLFGPQGSKGPRIELYYPLSYYFEGYPEARRRYEQAVARFPGFQAHNSGGRIVMDEAFTTKSAEALLKILRRLAKDVTGSPSQEG